MTRRGTIAALAFDCLAFWALLAAGQAPRHATNWSLPRGSELAALSASSPALAAPPALDLQAIAAGATFNLAHLTFPGYDPPELRSAPATPIPLSAFPAMHARWLACSCVRVVT